MPKVVVLATISTKSEEVDFLVAQLDALNVEAHIVDISLTSGGKVLDGAEKCHAMDRAANAGLGAVLVAVAKNAEVVVAIGGGIGGDIALQVLRGLPITFPKILVTTLPFDPRFAVADNSIILVPTLVDLAGLNTMLRECLENTALITACLCRKIRKGELIDIAKSVGITALGATDGAITPLAKAFADMGRETTVFHANGYGGAAFARFAEQDAFDAIIDLTPYELTRLHVAGMHAVMPDRFKAGADLPRVVLPGALNLIGLGQRSLVPDHYLDRPHHEHSGLFTHVKITTDEMVKVSSILADHLNALSGPCSVILPMGGAHQDCDGGPIEDPDLRQACRETLMARLNENITIRTLDAHISAPVVTQEILTSLTALSSQKDPV